MIKPLFRPFKPIPVIPTVYSDALSYGEQVGKLASKVDECVKGVNDIAEELNEFELDLTQYINAEVDKWLDEHPEATTTVEDYSLTLQKFTIGGIDFVTPQLFGAVGDGETDDSEAFSEAIDSGYNVIVPSGSYLINNMITVTKSTRIIFDTNVVLDCPNGFVSLNNKDNSHFYGNGCIINGTKQLNTGHSFNLYNASNIVVDGFVINNSSDDGVYLNHVNNVQISNNIINGSARNGISIISSDGFNINNNVIKNINTNNPKSCIDIEPNSGADNAILNGFIENLVMENSDQGLHIDLHTTLGDKINVICNNIKCNNMNTEIAFLSKTNMNITGNLKVLNYMSYNCKRQPITIIDVFKEDNIVIDIDGTFNNPNSDYVQSTPYTSSLIYVLNQENKDIGKINANLRVVNSNNTKNKYFIAYYVNSESTATVYANLDIECEYQITGFVQGTPSFIGKMNLPTITFNYNVSDGVIIANKINANNNISIDLSVLKIFSIIELTNTGSGTITITNSEGHIYPVDTNVGDSISISRGSTILLKRIGTVDYSVVMGNYTT